MIRRPISGELDLFENVKNLSDNFTCYHTNNTYSVVIIRQNLTLPLIIVVINIPLQTWEFGMGSFFEKKFFITIIAFFVFNFLVGRITKVLFADMYFEFTRSVWQTWIFLSMQYCILCSPYPKLPAYLSEWVGVGYRNKKL